MTFIENFINFVNSYTERMILLKYLKI